MIKWHIVSSNTFRTGSPIPGDMYFLSDTREIYRGSDPFTESVILHEGRLPDSPSINRLYINNKNLEGKVWTGEATGWKTVINAVSDEVIDQSRLPVSGKAVIAYVTEELSKLSTLENAVSSIAWNKDSHSINVTKGDGSSNIVTLDGLAASLKYIPDTRKIQMVDTSGNVLGNEVELDSEKFVHSGEYNAAEQSIILYFDDGKTDSISISLADLGVKLDELKNEVIKQAKWYTDTNAVAKKDIVTPATFSNAEGSDLRVVSESLLREMFTWKTKID